MCNGYGAGTFFAICAALAAFVAAGLEYMAQPAAGFAPVVYNTPVGDDHTTKPEEAVLAEPVMGQDPYAASAPMPTTGDLDKRDL